MGKTVITPANILKAIVAIKMTPSDAARRHFLGMQTLHYNKLMLVATNLVKIVVEEPEEPEMPELEDFGSALFFDTIDELESVYISTANNEALAIEGTK